MALFGLGCLLMIVFLLVVQVLIAAALVGVILMQRSEGGGLGVGGSPAGLMSARGAADFLTRTTTILAALFIGLSIAMAVLVAATRAPAKYDATLATKPATTTLPGSAPTGDPNADHLAPASPLSPLSPANAAGNTVAPTAPKK